MYSSTEAGGLAAIITKLGIQMEQLWNPAVLVTEYKNWFEIKLQMSDYIHIYAVFELNLVAGFTHDLYVCHKSSKSL